VGGYGGCTQPTKTKPLLFVSPPDPIPLKVSAQMSFTTQSMHHLQDGSGYIQDAAHFSTRLPQPPLTEPQLRAELTVVGHSSFSPELTLPNVVFVIQHLPSGTRS